MSAVIDKAREYECYEIEISTENSGKGARDFYEKLGFAANAVLFEKNFGSSY